MALQGNAMDLRHNKPHVRRQKSYGESKVAVDPDTAGLFEIHWSTHNCSPEL